MPPKNTASSKATSKTGGKPATKVSTKPAAAKTTVKSDATKPAKVEPVKPTTEQKEADKIATAADETWPIKQLADILTPDPEKKWTKSGKWPCLLDPTNTACTFLKYRNVNVLQATSQHDMQENNIRLALLGALRWSKPMLIDMGDLDLFDAVTKFFDNVQPGLLDKVLDKSIQKEENFSTLVRKTDDGEYQPGQFYEEHTGNFVFILGIGRDVPPPSCKSRMYYVLVQ